MEDEEAPAAESAPQGGTRKEEHQRRGDTASDDYYKVLGVERDADARDIKRAYRREGAIPALSLRAIKQNTIAIVTLFYHAKSSELYPLALLSFTIVLVLAFLNR